MNRKKKTQKQNLTKKKKKSLFLNHQNTPNHITNHFYAINQKKKNSIYRILFLDSKKKFV